MKPHQLMFGDAALMLLSSILLAMGENFALASSALAGTIIVCVIGWGMLLTERGDAARHMEDAKQKALLSKENALK